MIDNNFPFYIGAFILTFILTVFLSRSLIPLLKSRAAQPIYEDGPSWHIKKSGTPTMGGLAFLISISLVMAASAVILFLMDKRQEAISLAVSVGYSILNSVVGIIDDSEKLKKKENAGLTPIQKLALQFVIAVVFLYTRHILLGDDTAIYFSFGDINLRILYYPISIIILLGITNCANLTDGIDGLASGVAFAVGVSLFYVACALCTEVCFISAAIMGAACGFLIFNLHPAKIFMGDTGSLFLGSLAASCAFALRNPFVIVFIGGIYVIEGLSVIIQVTYYKLTKKRIFKMAPLHHHMEKCGWSENKICLVAILLTFLMSIPAFIYYLP